MTLVQELAGSTTMLNQYWPIAFIMLTRTLNAAGFEMKEFAPRSYDSRDVRVRR